MGTRHLIAAHVDGQYKIAQYGQWDGYPSGQGLTVLRFMRNADKQLFADKCRKAQFLDEAGFVVLQSQLDEQGESWWDEHKHLSRDAGGKVLEMVYNAPDGIQLKNSISFAADSLFCEWAYVVDFDVNTLEVFKGFNQTPLIESERFAKMENEEDSKYTPVRLVTTFNLDNLPSDEEFLAALREEDEE